MSQRQLSVFAPATVANVACGFDIFGFALEAPGDELIVSLTSNANVEIVKISGDGGVLSLDPRRNTAGVSVIRFLEHLNSRQGVAIELHKKMPLGSGLGSSAASAVGSVFAVNALLGSPLSPQALIPFAMEGEKMACGSAHADNVAPALLGGFTLIRGYSPLDVISIPCGIDLHCSLLHPKIEISTEMARKLLGKQITLRQHVEQTGNAVGLAMGLMMGDTALIARSLCDVIAEPVRASLIPGFEAIKKAALSAGALGCSISGSGPSIFALSASAEHAAVIGEAMEKACRDEKVSCDLHISPLNRSGPRVMG